MNGIKSRQFDMQWSWRQVITKNLLSVLLQMINVILFCIIIQKKIW